MKQLLTVIFLLTIFFAFSQKVKMGTYNYLFGEYSQTISIYNDSLFNFSEKKDNYSETGKGIITFLDNKMILNFDSLDIKQKSSEIKKTLISENFSDTFKLVFIIKDLLTKEAIPFAKIKIHSENSEFTFNTDYDGLSIINFPKNQIIRNIEVSTELHKVEILKLDTVENYKIEILLSPIIEKQMNEKIEFGIIKFRSKGIYLNYYGDKRFYKKII